MADVLPDCSRRDTIIAPNQASQLSGAIEIRMWSVADTQQHTRVKAEKSEDESGSSAQHEGGQRCRILWEIYLSLTAPSCLRLRVPEAASWRSTKYEKH